MNDMESPINELKATWTAVFNINFADNITDMFIGDSCPKYISFAIPIDEMVVFVLIFILPGQIGDVGRLPKVRSGLKVVSSSMLLYIV